jgi:hypothetical protein
MEGLLSRRWLRLIDHPKLATQGLLIGGYRLDRLTQRSYCGRRHKEDDQCT